MRSRILSGKWAPGEQLPNLQQLAATFKVTPVTARHAVSRLADENLVWCQQGKGTFVTEELGLQRSLTLATDWEALVTLLRGTVPTLLDMADHRLPTNFDQIEGTPAEAYQYLHRVHTMHGTPYCVIEIYLDKNLYRKNPTAFQQKTALSLLHDDPEVIIGSAWQHVCIGTADMETAQLLEVALDAPVAYVRRVVLDSRRRIIYIGDVVYRGDFLNLHIKLR
jgi:GntR family transcriptional regulator